METDRSRLVLGTLLGLLAAVGYTATNVGLRTVSGLDPYWVSCIKAWPTIVVAAPWLCRQLRQGQRVSPGWPVFGLLVAASLIGHLLGNVVFQWALGVIGIALTVPVTLGSLIVSGTVMGRLFLREPVTPRTAFAVMLLVVAIAILSRSADSAYSSVVGNLGSSWQVGLGLMAAMLAGVAYAILGVVIRYGVTHQASTSFTLLTVATVGALALALPAGLRLGWDGMAAIPLDRYGWMLFAGSCNALAFMALTKAFQMTTMVYVNALNGSQAAMAAVAGVVIFHEAPSASLWLGLLLTLAGLMCLQPQHEPHPDVAAKSPPP